MLIELIKSGKRKDVPDKVGAYLVKAKVAREVYETRVVAPEVEKPKRQYRRRDMKAE